MQAWLKGKFQSITFRLLLTFFVILLALSSVIGYSLNNAFHAEKVEDLRWNFILQSEAVKLNISGRHNSVSEALLYFETDNRFINKQNNIYVYGENNQVWELKLNAQPPLSTYIVVELQAELLALQDKAIPASERFGVLLEDQDEYYFATQLTPEMILIITDTGQEIKREIEDYQFSLFGWLVFVVMFLLASFTLVLGAGLRPLDKMSQGLQDIAKGKTDQLQDEYATEFEYMRENLNNLLNAERVQRERYRNTLADLAHSLKTPLAVMQGAVNEKLDYQSYLSMASEQIRRMDQIIQYQLTRAVKSNDDGTMANAILVTPVIERILSALGKVYRDKDVNVILNVERSIELNADERDLMEMLGNMLENAFKYCRAEVAVSMTQNEQYVYIDIEDDGAGVSEHMRHTILERGERADTSAAPGQGIGLSVSVDILSTYDCRLVVEDSFSLGGAKFSITFPRN